MGFFLVGYIVGRPLYWHLSEFLTAKIRSSTLRCHPCSCDCSSQPLLTLPEGLSNSSFTDCMKHDPEVSHEIEKSFTDMLSEELRLNEEEAQKKQQRADVALLEAKRMTSQYQKEAEKCNFGMDTCEAARERAEEVLQEQRKLSAKWEFRARERGWREGLMRSQGCDASILLDSGNSELFSSKNLGIVLAAKESVEFSGGPQIQIPLGRKDSTTSNNKQSDDLRPSPAVTVDELLHIFMSKGMNLEVSVAILGNELLTLSSTAVYIEKHLQTLMTLKIINASS
ncbi:hypothetical protein NC652_010067 [Populus alba x Populus x berolinensis]|nr:hypothetical protein NC652_010067 [Populus alba x Populus x berolinensis]